LEFTGERFVPGVEGLEELYTEHMSRYLLASRMASGKTVLDVGCGCGYGTHLLATGGARAVLGIDSSEEAIAYSAEHYRHPALVFSVMDAERPGLDRAFDLITCFEMIEHVPHPSAVLEGMARALAPGGLVMVSTPNRLVYRAGGEDGSNPYHYREYSREEFDGLLDELFPHRMILDQRWVEGIAFRPEGIQEEGIHSALPAPQRVSPPKDQGPPYFLALAAREAVLPESAALPLTLAVDAGCPRWRWGKTHLRNLEEEFDRRGRWAQSLDAGVKERDRTIESLRRERDEIRAESDGRGRWGQGLERRIKELEAHIVLLERENLRVRRVAAGMEKGNVWNGRQ
jgi:SAM-dependent methyltransferase